MKILVSNGNFLQNPSTADNLLNNKVLWMSSPVYDTVFSSFRNLVIKLIPLSNVQWDENYTWTHNIEFTSLGFIWLLHLLYPQFVNRIYLSTSFSMWHYSLGFKLTKRKKITLFPFHHRDASIISIDSVTF